MSEPNEAFNCWFAENYERLVSLADRYTSEPHDLLHHVYLRVVKADPPRIMDNPFGYLHRALYFEATRGAYKRLMKTGDALPPDLPYEQDFDHLVKLEQLQVWASMLHPFDRVLLQLYMDGWNMAEVARGSGIPASTIKTSIHRTKKKLHAVANNRQNKE